MLVQRINLKPVVQKPAGMGSAAGGKRRCHTSLPKPTKHISIVLWQGQKSKDQRHHRSSIQAIRAGYRSAADWRSMVLTVCAGCIGIAGSDMARHLRAAPSMANQNDTFSKPCCNLPARVA